MKTKNQAYLFVASIFFLSVFLVGVGANKAKADCASDCQSMATDDAGILDEGLYGECYASYDCYNVDNAPLDSAITDTSLTDAGCKITYGQQAYLAEDDTCQQFDASTEMCTEDNDCVLSKGLGYQCDTSSGNCVPNGLGGLTGDECKTNQDCVDNFGTGYVCQGYLQKTCEKGAATPKEKKKASDAKTDALAATSTAAKAAQDVAIKTAAVATACSASATTTAACTTAKNELNAAKDTLTTATAAATEAVTTANELAVAAGTGNASTGAGFSLCDNGILAISCSGGGTPYVAGISTGNYLGSGLGGNYTSSGLTTVKCGAGFTDIGGVCFPGNTGLSNASIYTILANLFSWLMGLFTTFAVLAFVVSGIQYFMSAGDEGMAESAKDNAKSALIGIVIGLSGFIVVKAIAAALSGQSYFF